MPYSVPSPVLQHSDLPPIKLRPKHRRTRSAFPDVPESTPPTDDRPHIPRRRQSRPLFHFTDDDDEENDNDHDEDNDDANNTPALTIDTSPSNLQVPFPSVQSPNRSPSPSHSGHLSPQHISHSAPLLARSSSASTTASTTTSTSSPIIYLANGKPLKPSLKSSHSSPHIPSVRVHTRAQSEPSTPAVKNVHFPEQDDALKSVRIFDKSGKPASLSRVAGEETETETEGYDSSSQQPRSSSYPFPSIRDAPAVFEINPTSTSVIPPPHYIPSADSNIHLETLVLPPSRPLVLRGSVLVRNIAFTKDLAVRFTLDEWQTTSEVCCRHVVSLPGLPPPFAPPNTPPRKTFGDLAGVLAYHSHRSPSQAEWDRFSFSINLEDVERKLDTKTLWLVIRYTVPGHGEWWDNNEGSNYRVGFKVSGDGEKENLKEKERQILEQREAAREMASAHSQQRSFNPPNTLRTTPMSGYTNVARPPPMMRSHSSPQPATVTIRNANATNTGSSWTLPSRLSLLNYSAPSKAGKVSPPPLPTENEASKTSPSMGQTATPPMTPPQAGMNRLVDEIDRQTGKGSAGVYDEHVAEGDKSSGKGSPTTPRLKMVMVGGMPASVFSNSPSPSPNASGSEKERDSDSGERAKKMGGGLGFAQTRPVPTRRTSPPNYFTGIHHPSANANGNGNANTYAGASVSSGTTSPLPTDSSYAAFVKHWCFVQSPTPSPSTTTTTASTAVTTPTAASTASPTPTSAATTIANAITSSPISNSNLAANHGASVASNVVPHYQSPQQQQQQQLQRNHSRASSGGGGAHPWFLNGGGHGHQVHTAHTHGHGHGDALGLYYPRSDSPMLAGM